MEKQEPRPPALLPPGLRERFEVVGVLGRGGMGLVLRVRDRRMGREVALKLMQGEMTAATRERFVREGQLASSMTHPGIVQVHSAGEVEGTLFLVQELVPGARTLREVEDSAQALRLLVEAGRGLGAAHALGIVHRDVKPENLLVGESGALKVSDFGVALGLELERMTVSGALVGTPSYMAPEQIGGVRAEVCPATDVWGLGVILYELVSGELPFEAANLVELIGMIQRGAPPLPTPPPLSMRAIREVCARALAPRPQDRFSDGAAFADALQDALVGKEPPRRGPGLLRLAALSLVGLGALGALGALGLARPPNPSPSGSPNASPSPSLGGDGLSPADKALIAARRARKDRAAALWRWCLDHPGDPRRAAVRRELAEQAPPRPVLSFEVGPPAGNPQLLFHEGSLWTWRSGVTQRREWPRLSPTDLGFSAAFMSPAPEGWLVFERKTRRLRRFRRGVLEPATFRNGIGVISLGGNRAFLYNSAKVRRINVATGELLGVFFEARSQIRHAAFDPRRKQFVLAMGDIRPRGVPENGTVRSWILGRKRSQLSLKTSGAPTRLSLIEGELTIGTSLGVIRAFDPESLNAQAIYHDTQDESLIPLAHEDSIKELAASPTGEHLASTAPSRGRRGREEGGVVRIWSRATRKSLRALTFSATPTTLGFSPDGEVLLIGLRGGRVEGYLVP